MFGEVQRPQVCLLSCDMYIEKVYLGVPVNREVVLHNKSLLRAQFKWKEVSAETKIKVHLTPIFFSAEMKLSNIHKRNLPIFLVSDNFKGFEN